MTDLSPLHVSMARRLGSDLERWAAVFKHGYDAGSSQMVSWGAF